MHTKTREIEMKRVMISGVAGFIGQNLSRAFLNKGWKVFGIDNLLIGKKEWLHRDVCFFEFDTCSNHQFPVKKYDLFVHLAARQIPRQESAYNLLCENTQGLKNMAKHAANINARFIYFSTSEVYGKNEHLSETDSSILGTPDISRWSYSVSKIWGEQLLYSMPQHFNFNIIRLFNTYGLFDAPSLTSSPFSIFISQALKKEALTIHSHGQQRRSFQYVDDAVDGVMRIVESDYKREVFNIGNPNEPISIRCLAQTIWDRINPDEKIKLNHVPHSTFKYEEIQKRVPDISRAKEWLGFDPKIGIDEGLKRTIEWQRTAILSGRD